MKKFISILITVVLLITMSTSAFAAGPSPYSVFGDDDAILINDTTRLPYSAICKLYITFPGSRYIEEGTGFMVSSKYLATAGHCLYKHATKTWASSVRVVPGANGGEEPFGEFVLDRSNSKKMVLTAWHDDGNTNFDIGEIMINNEADSGIGYLDLYAPSSSELTDAEISICGYPGTLKRPDGTDVPTLKQRSSSGVPIDFDSQVIKFQIDTLPGMSGSPVFDTDMNVIGIYNYGLGDPFFPNGKPDDVVNKCSRLTTGIIATLSEATVTPRAMIVEP